MNPNHVALGLEQAVVPRTRGTKAYMQ